MNNRLRKKKARSAYNPQKQDPGFISFLISENERETERNISMSRRRFWESSAIFG